MTGDVTMPFYLTPEQHDFNQDLHICIAEALYMMWIRLWRTQGLTQKNN